MGYCIPSNIFLKGSCDYTQRKLFTLYAQVKNRINEKFLLLEFKKFSISLYINLI